MDTNADIGRRANMFIEAMIRKAGMVRRDTRLTLTSKEESSRLRHTIASR